MPMLTPSSEAMATTKPLLKSMFPELSLLSIPAIEENTTKIALH